MLMVALWIDCAGSVVLTTVETLVVDEADMVQSAVSDCLCAGHRTDHCIAAHKQVLSFGYADDIRTIVSHLPKICQVSCRCSGVTTQLRYKLTVSHGLSRPNEQSFLMSATLSPELEDLKRLVLTKPAILRLEGGESDGACTHKLGSRPHSGCTRCVVTPGVLCVLCVCCRHTVTVLCELAQQGQVLGALCAGAPRVDQWQGHLLCQQRRHVWGQG